MDAKSSVGYVSWEEMSVSSDKGRREVHYYLKGVDGGLDLAVIGKERSMRHMSYHYFIKNDCSLKLKSRREVVDWLNSIVSDTAALESSHVSGSLHNSDAPELDDENFKVSQPRKPGHCSKEFSWLGSPWTCRKRRKHYQSFYRNGVKISVNGFVYVLAEEDKRLIAYLEDMYEDSKGNKMVVVRWYHKIDEVAIALPSNFNDREVFYSLCLQDLSVECIDGVATVISPHHFEKFQKVVKHTVLDLYVCNKQFENDAIRPFDITQVKGYRRQELLRHVYNASSVTDQANVQQPDDVMNPGAISNDDSLIRPWKRHRQLKDDVFAGCEQPMDSMDWNNGWVDCKIQAETSSLTRGEFPAPLLTTEAKQNPLQYLKVGSEVEVLSQDSGIRGCWFRASIIKVHKYKVKVRYQDIKDGDNEDNNLEEWILSTRVAVPDHLGFRLCGRPIIRPSPKINKGQVSWDFDAGSAVDVWWHDVWQEGIVVRKESEDRFHVYFPGEKQESVFGRADLRHSQEWLGNGWMRVKDRADIVTSISSFLDKQVVKLDNSTVVQAVVCDTKQSERVKAGSSHDLSDSGSEDGGELKVVRDLSKDDRLAQLRWNSSKKRRRSSGIPSQRMHYSKNAADFIRSHFCERFVLPISLKVDHEICKSMGDSLFSSAVAQPLTSLVMSR